jgi:import inner membrane translocase subunit TIM21
MFRKPTVLNEAIQFSFRVNCIQNGKSSKFVSQLFKAKMPLIRQFSSTKDCQNSINGVDRDSKVKSTAQEKVNNFIYHVKTGSRLVLSSWLIILAGGATLVTTYLIATELFSPSGETSTFNRVVNLIEKDEKCLKLLGYSDVEIEQGGIRLKAYGGVSPDLWTRNKPVQATKFSGKDEKEHMIMRFFVESSKNIGVVNLEAIEENFIEQELVYVSLDVKGHNRYYLIGGPHLSYAQRNMNLFNSNGFLGVRWGSSKKD